MLKKINFSLYGQNFTSLQYVSFSNYWIEAGMADSELIETLALELEQNLLKAYGPLMAGESLFNALGYRSADALRQAVSRRTAPVPVFPIKKRKGKFALTKDVAYWLAKQRIENV
jgi:hypothetical protein